MAQVEVYEVFRLTEGITLVAGEADTPEVDVPGTASVLVDGQPAGKLTFSGRRMPGPAFAGKPRMVVLETREAVPWDASSIEQRRIRLLWE